jgi:ATP-dependent DNA ligase
VNYNKFFYIYPPRPIQTTKHTELGKYDDGQFIAQPKYNGTCCVVFMNETETIVMNRHNGKITTDYSQVEFRGLYRPSGWMVLCGEFLNKNKKGENNQSFNIKFIVWDILVYKGEYLIGMTMLERLKLLDKLYPCSKISVEGNKMETFHHLCFTSYKNIYVAPYYEGYFEELYDSIVKTDLYEGLVLKRKNAKLTIGLNEKNNNEWQIKCRKPTKNYQF